MAKQRRRSRPSISNRHNNRELDIVIPVYGRPDLLRECLQSLEIAALDVNYQLFLVDDASPDKSAMEVIYSSQNSNTKILQNAQNKGFPATANRGAALGKSQSILILNSDVMLQAGAVRKMLNTLWGDQSAKGPITPSPNALAGVVGPKLLFPDASNIPPDARGKVQHAGLAIHAQGRPFHIQKGWEADNPRLDQPRAMQAVTGACMMTRRDVWRAVARTYQKAGDPSGGAFNEIYGLGCLSGDTLVFTDDGLKRLKNMMGVLVDTSINMYVASKKTHQTATIAHKNGAMETLKVILEKRFEITGTPDHKIISMSPDGLPHWKAIEDLRLGDYVAIRVGANLWGKKEFLLDDAYFLGLYTAEGCTETTSTGRPTRITITNTDTEIQDFIYSLGFKQQKQKIHWRSIGGYPVIKKWFDYGLNPDQKAASKQVPNAVLEGTKEVVIAFLQGLFDGDGSAHNDGRVTLATNSETLAREVQMLLLNLGLVSGIYPKPKNGWTVELGRNMEAFFERVGFRLSRKQNKAHLARSSHSYVVPFHRQHVRIAYDAVPTGKGKNVSHARFAHNPSPHITYKGVEQVLELCDQHETEPPKRLEEALSEGYYWAKVRQIKGPYFEETFDLHIPKNNAYVANGLIVHNTYEDVEYCFAARGNGYKVVFEPAAVGYHHVGASVAQRPEGGYPLGRNHSIFMARCGHLLFWDEWLFW